MTLEQFNEAYRELLQAGEGWFVEEGAAASGVVRLYQPGLRWESGVYRTFCPITAVAYRRTGRFYGVGHYSTAASVELDMERGAASFVAAMADGDWPSSLTGSAYELARSVW
jgi:hypothetical protein